MICIAIALDQLDGSTGRKGLENCSLKIKYYINSFPSIGVFVSHYNWLLRKTWSQHSRNKSMHTFDLCMDP